jgi:hypothetical protein
MQSYTAPFIRGKETLLKLDVSREPTPFGASPPLRGASRREQGEARARNEPRETQRPEWRAGGWGTGARGGGVVSAASARKIPGRTITRIMLGGNGHCFGSRRGERSSDSALISKASVAETRLKIKAAAPKLFCNISDTSSFNRPGTLATTIESIGLTNLTENQRRAEAGAICSAAPREKVQWRSFNASEEVHNGKLPLCSRNYP